MTPSPGQGVIALVVRENDNNLSFLKKVNHPSSFIESECERIYLSALDGSCETPVGALAKIKLIKKKKRFILIIWLHPLMDLNILRIKLILT